VSRGIKGMRGWEEKEMALGIRRTKIKKYNMN